MSYSENQIDIMPRYTNSMAYHLTNSVTLSILFPIAFICLLASGLPLTDESTDLSQLPGAIIGVLLLILIDVTVITVITRKLCKRTPKGERLATWFSCYFHGWKVAFSKAIKMMSIGLPFLAEWSTCHYDYPYTGIVNGTPTRLKKRSDGLYEDMNGHLYRDRT